WTTTDREARTRLNDTNWDTADESQPGTEDPAEDPPPGDRDADRPGTVVEHGLDPVLESGLDPVRRSTDPVAVRALDQIVEGDRVVPLVVDSQIVGVGRIAGDQQWLPSAGRLFREGHVEPKVPGLVGPLYGIPPCSIGPVQAVAPPQHEQVAC